MLHRNVFIQFGKLSWRLRTFDKRIELIGRNSKQRHVETKLREVNDFETQQMLIPTAVFGQLIVGDHVGLLLRVRPTASDNNRHLI